MSSQIQQLAKPPKAEADGIAASGRPGLVPGPRASLAASISEIASDFWAHRDLLHQLTLRDIRLRYKQAVMGFAWSILTPTLIVLSGVIVRVAMARYAGTALAVTDIANV